MITPPRIAIVAVINSIYIHKVPKNGVNLGLEEMVYNDVTVVQSSTLDHV